MALWASFIFAVLKVRCTIYMNTVRSGFTFADLEFYDKRLGLKGMTL